MSADGGACQSIQAGARAAASGLYTDSLYLKSCLYRAVRINIVAILSRNSSYVLFTILDVQALVSRVLAQWRGNSGAISFWWLEATILRLWLICDLQRIVKAGVTAFQSSIRVGNLRSETIVSHPSKRHCL